MATDTPAEILQGISATLAELKASFATQTANTQATLAVMQENFDSLQADFRALRETVRGFGVSHPTEGREAPDPTLPGFTPVRARGASPSSRPPEVPRDTSAQREVGDTASQLSEGEDPSGWDRLARQRLLPEKVKVDPLPSLAVRGREGGQPYFRWRQVARSALAAAHCRSLLEIQPPTDEQSVEVRAWYLQATEVVYHALMRAVVDVPVLGDDVLRLEGTPGAAHRAWRLIQSFFYREAETNQSKL